MVWTDAGDGSQSGRHRRRSSRGRRSDRLSRAISRPGTSLTDALTHSCGRGRSTQRAAHHHSPLTRGAGRRNCLPRACVLAPPRAPPPALLAGIRHALRLDGGGCSTCHRRPPAPRHASPCASDTSALAASSSRNGRTSLYTPKRAAGLFLSLDSCLHPPNARPPRCLPETATRHTHTHSHTLPHPLPLSHAHTSRAPTHHHHHHLSRLHPGRRSLHPLHAPAPSLTSPARLFSAAGSVCPVPIAASCSFEPRCVVHAAFRALGLHPSSTGTCTGPRPLVRTSHGLQHPRLGACASEKASPVRTLARTHWPC